MGMRNKGQFQKGQHWRPHKPWWDKEWLQFQYTDAGQSAADIAMGGGVMENAILF
jgi:hypothetical protein